MRRLPIKRRLPRVSKSFAGMIAVVPIKRAKQLASDEVVEPEIGRSSPEIARAVALSQYSVSEISGVGKLVKPVTRGSM